MFGLAVDVAAAVVAAAVVVVAVRKHFLEIGQENNAELNSVLGSGEPKWTPDEIAVQNEQQCC